ncbi:MAG: S-layer homology domain-containing protein [Lyngbya sp.]|nr:S-layer homology domain-containing protein [Lyngbya sp.]
MKRFVQIAGLAIAIASLNACANSSLEEAFKPDPQLQNNPPFGQSNASTPPETDQTFVELPKNFPSQIPLYPNAQLRDVTASEKDSEIDVITHWKTNDPINLVENYYQQQFESQNWQIVERPNAEGEGLFVARQDNLQVTLSVKPNSISNTETDFEIRYIQDSENIAKNSDSDKSISTIPLPPPPPPVTSNDTPTPDAKPTDSPTVAVSPTPTTSPTPRPTPTTSPSPEASNSSPALDTVPQELREFVSDVSKLGVLQSSPGRSANSANRDQIIANPNETITRGEFARWLVNANNNFYSNTPAKQIRLGVSSSQPVFTDVPTSHPYFPEIQGLAEAGLIPSSLSGDSAAVSFRPDAPLTREDMVLWKVPLDTRQALPKATVDAVQERWGFQDTSKIDSNALRAILADFDNGDNANIRRVFGFTTLFQPKKPVTRAEAASSLWYFGFQGDGISAEEVLAQNQTQDSENSSN